MRQLASYPRQNGVAAALRELGRLERTLFTLDWTDDPELRRATGQELNKALLRGEVRLIAATATRLRPPAARELGRVSGQQWRELRRRLDQRRPARTLRARFRRNPDTYLAELEQKTCQPTLPAQKIPCQQVMTRVGVRYKNETRNRDSSRYSR